MRRIYAERPGYYTACACQYGGGACLSSDKPGRHARCHLGAPLPQPETLIVGHDQMAAAFTEPYRHPAVSATGWHPTRTAQVWLADRVCAWSCPCECGHPGPEPAHAHHPGPLAQQPRRRPPMSAEAAAWVREHAWTARMRLLFERLPSTFTLCACQWASGSCRWSGEHATCDRALPLPYYETCIYNQHGHSLELAESFRHATPYPAGWLSSSDAMVWLADRTCREVCACGCNHDRHHGAPYSPARRPPAAPPPAPTPTRAPVTSPGAQVMTEAQAAWVREHVWTETMRRVQETHPGFYTVCFCQRGPCAQCTGGDHERCRFPKPLFSREGMIASRTGAAPACFAQPYAHRTRDGAPQPTTVAQVWLADRVCCWVCTCECRTTAPGSPPGDVDHAPVTGAPEMLPGFDLLPTLAPRPRPRRPRTTSRPPAAGMEPLLTDEDLTAALRPSRRPDTTQTTITTRPPTGGPVDHHEQ
ncbi:DUF6248 family natural product biosynthesis protein [Planobispora takensis]|nr:DUF6248 family natural product biosynthesis protein [Planobispora takensis]